MEHSDQETQGRTAEEELERIVEAPETAWEDEWVDIGGEG
jgi:hypothetical protein